ncbi:hypothetical protein [Tenacibaculum sp. 190130A14a]|uniref:Uncharacterized protein n=1 Tax=Tenacibaculum polynesiense TaxID=3137857 RepID=A0ABM9P8A3_9FLAO
MKAAKESLILMYEMFLFKTNDLIDILFVVFVWVGAIIVLLNL